MVTWHSSIFQIIPWSWKPLMNRKVQGKKVFWHMKLYSSLCNISVSFSSKLKATNVVPKHILKSKARDESIQARKKLFCLVIVKNYLCNILWEFLIKIKSLWRSQIKEQTSQLTLLYCDSTVRSSHWRCSIRKLFLKILQYPQQTPALESIF